MDAICLLVAGIVVGSLADSAFELEWQHSVQKTLWSERYRVEGRNLRLVSARIEASGAGMEPPPDAQRDGSGWRWNPDRLLTEVTLAHSAYADDYRICTRSGCRSMREGLPAAATEGSLTIKPCASASDSR